MTTLSYDAMTDKARRRMNALMTLLAVHKVEIGVLDWSTNPVFSENVDNREDDGDPTRLCRYVLVRQDDPSDECYFVHDFTTQRGLAREVAGNAEDCHVIAFDLDKPCVLAPYRTVTVQFVRADHRGNQIG